jgi:hypothetical protein
MKTKPAIIKWYRIRQHKLIVTGAVKKSAALFGTPRYYHVQKNPPLDPTKNLLCLIGKNKRRLM